MIITQEGVSRRLSTTKPYLLNITKEEAQGLRDQLERATYNDFSVGTITIFPFDWFYTGSKTVLDWDQGIKEIYPNN